MGNALLLHTDRLFPADTCSRAIAHDLYNHIKDLPIISPHGHTDPAWFAEDIQFKNPHELFIQPDHYLIRMLYSQGIKLADLGIASKQGGVIADPRSAWRTFAKHYYLFHGTPTGFWLNHIFAELFDQKEQLDESTADHYFDSITADLQTESFRVRRLFEDFNIEFLSTTESPLDELKHHKAINASNWQGRVTTSYRPDVVIDADSPGFRTALAQFGEITGEDVYTWDGCLAAHRKRRAAFIALGATSTDHGHPSAATANLSTTEAEALFQRILSSQSCAADHEFFRAQMLTEMARMSLDDGMVMQIHPGSFRNHNNWLYGNYGHDRGADLPTPVNYTQALKPLLDQFGNESALTIILFTLDESNYSRELAPLAGHYPCLRLGPAWWFNDSPEGMMRFREYTTETAGFYNTVGFNDDTRAFLSIPARHDMARRVDCSYLARLVADHRLTEEDAYKIATDLTYSLPKQAYHLNGL